MLYSKIFPKFHKRWVFERRVQVLASTIAELLPTTGTVLDVGCGDGKICKLILEKKPELQIQGVEVHKRPNCAIPVNIYDGLQLPLEDNSQDFVTFVDVLHHADSPFDALKEAARVAKHGIIIKDHLCETPLDRGILSFMDKVGNISHGVALPDNYLSRKQWGTIRDDLNLRQDFYNEQLGLYPFFAKFIFEKGLHFVARYHKHPSQE